MNYRFLTEQEFKDIGKWSEGWKHPTNWNTTMLKYLGKPVPEEYWDYCVRKVDFQIRDREEQETWYIRPDEYTHLPLPIPLTLPELKFKVGDKVNIAASSEFNYQGKLGDKYLLGTIISAKYSTIDDYWYKVEWEDKTTNSYKERDLVFYQITHRFKIGDVVRVVQSGHGFGSEVIGAIAEIKELTTYSEGPGYIVSWPKLKFRDIDRHYYDGPEAAHGEASFELALTQSRPNSSDVTEMDLDKAKRLYPVGTVFTPAHVNQLSNYCIITDDTIIKEIAGDIIATVNGENWGKEEKYGNTAFDRVIYCHTMKKWAEIISPTPIITPQYKEENVPGDFKEGDYIVSLVDKGEIRKTGDVFVALSFTSNGNVYYEENTNGDRDTFRKAYPHEIPRHLSKAPYELSSPKKQDITLIEPVHSVKHELRTKKTKFKF